MSQITFMEYMPEYIEKVKKKVPNITKKDAIKAASLSYQAYKTKKLQDYHDAPCDEDWEIKVAGNKCIKKISSKSSYPSPLVNVAYNTQILDAINQHTQQHQQAQQNHDSLLQLQVQQTNLMNSILDKLEQKTTGQNIVINNNISGNSPPTSSTGSNTNNDNTSSTASVKQLNDYIKDLDSKYHDTAQYHDESIRQINNNLNNLLGKVDAFHNEYKGAVNDFQTKLGNQIQGVETNLVNAAQDNSDLVNSIYNMLIGEKTETAQLRQDLDNLTKIRAEIAQYHSDNTKMYTTNAQDIQQLRSMQTELITRIQTDSARIQQAQTNMQALIIQELKNQQQQNNINNNNNAMYNANGIQNNNEQLSQARAQIEFLQNQNRNTTNQLQMVQAQLNAKILQIGDLTTNSQNLTMQIDRLNSQIRANQAKDEQNNRFILDLQAQKDQLSRDVQTLRFQNTQLQHDSDNNNMNLSAQLNQVRNQLKTTAQELFDKEIELNQIITENKNIKNWLNDHDRDQKNLEDQITNLNRYNSDLTREKNRLEQQLQTLNNNKNDNNNNNTQLRLQLEQDLKTCNSELERKNTEINTLKLQVQTFHIESNKLKVQLDSVTKLEHQVATLETEKKQLDEMISHITQAKVKEEADNEALEQQLDEKNKRIQELDAKQTILSNELETERNQHTEYIANLLESRKVQENNLNQHIEVLTKQLVEEKAKQTTNEQKILDLSTALNAAKEAKNAIESKDENELQKVKSQLATQIQLNEATSAKVKDLNNQAADLNTKYIALEKTNTLLEQEKKNLNERINDLNQTILDVNKQPIVVVDNDQIEKLKQEIEQLNQELAKKDKYLGKIEIRIDELGQKLKSATTENDQLNQNLQDLKTAFSEKESVFTKTEKDLKEQIDKLLQTKGNVDTDAKNNLAKQITEYQQLLQKYDAATKQIEEMKTKLNDADLKTNDYENLKQYVPKLETLLQQVTETEEFSQNTQLEFNRLYQELNTKLEQCTSLTKTQLQEIQRLKDQVALLEGNNNNKFRDELKKIQKTRDDLQSELDSTKKTNKVTIEKLQDNLQNQLVAFRKLQNEFEIKQANITELETQLIRLKSEQKVSPDEYKKSIMLIQNLQNKLAESENTNANYEKILNQFNALYDAGTIKLKTLENNFANLQHENIVLKQQVTQNETTIQQYVKNINNLEQQLKNGPKQNILDFQKKLRQYQAELDFFKKQNVEFKAQSDKYYNDEQEARQRAADLENEKQQVIQERDKYLKDGREFEQLARQRVENLENEKKQAIQERDKYLKDGKKFEQEARQRVSGLEAEKKELQFKLQQQTVIITQLQERIASLQSAASLDNQNLQSNTIPDDNKMQDIAQLRYTPQIYLNNVSPAEKLHRKGDMEWGINKALNKVKNKKQALTDFLKKYEIPSLTDSSTIKDLIATIAQHFVNKNEFVSFSYS